MTDTTDELEKEKADLMKRISEARKAAPDSQSANKIAGLQQQLARM